MTNKQIKYMETDLVEEEVDLEHSKRNFMNLIQENIKQSDQKTDKITHIKYSASYTKEKINQTIQSIKNGKVNDKYAVYQRDGKDMLILKMNHINGPVVQVLSYEDVFDIFMDLHIKLGHVGKTKMMMQAGNNYKYPSMTLTLIPEVCTVCINRQRSMIFDKKLNQISLVFVINMIQCRKNEKFRYILIHVDQTTNYTLLRPMIAKTDLEIAMEMFKIFTQFGPPDKVCLHGYNVRLTERVGTYVRMLCPMFDILFEHKSMEFNIPTLVMDRLEDWLRKTKSDCWELGCCAVQREINTDIKMNPGVTKCNVSPYTLYFNETLQGESEKNRKWNPRKKTTDSTEPEKRRQIIQPENQNHNTGRQQSIQEDPVEISIPSPELCDVVYSVLDSLESDLSQDTSGGIQIEQGSQITQQLRILEEKTIKSTEFLETTEVKDDSGGMQYEEVSKGICQVTKKIQILNVQTAKPVKCLETTEIVNVNEEQIKENSQDTQQLQILNVRTIEQAECLEKIKMTNLNEDDMQVDEINDEPPDEIDDKEKENIYENKEGEINKELVIEIDEEEIHENPLNVDTESNTLDEEVLDFGEVIEENIHDNKEGEINKERVTEINEEEIHEDPLNFDTESNSFDEEVVDFGEVIESMDDLKDLNDFTTEVEEMIIDEELEKTQPEKTDHTIVNDKETHNMDGNITDDLNNDESESNSGPIETILVKEKHDLFEDENDIEIDFGAEV